jgi:twitching motility two-component system response regulator PilG
MSASESFNGVTVMVIDDSNTIRRSAEIFLGKTGAKVVLAEDGFDALAKIADHQPDLIFCDVLMPRLDGYQTCALIKKSPKFKTTPVVMLSSKDGLFDKAKGRMVGSDHYLTKPFTKDSLLQAVGEFARRGDAATSGVASARAAVQGATPAHSENGRAMVPNAAVDNTSVPGVVNATTALPPIQPKALESAPAFTLNLTPQFAESSQPSGPEVIDIIPQSEHFTLSLV